MGVTQAAPVIDDDGLTLVLLLQYTRCSNDMHGQNHDLSKAVWRNQTKSYISRCYIWWTFVMKILNDVHVSRDNDNTDG